MKLKPLYLISIVIFSSALFWYNVTNAADTLASFYVDEIPNTQAAVSLFTTGYYRSDLYDLLFSSGIATTWPSAIGWGMGHSLFASRLSCAFFSWCLGLVLGYCFFTRQGFSRLEAIAISVLLWAMTTTTPLAFPYWHGFIYNLGEFIALMLIGIGLLLLPRHQTLGVFVLGVAVWHGKVLCFLLVAAILLGDLLSRKLPPKEMVQYILRSAVIFFLPLFLWMAWLYLRFDAELLNKWMGEQMWWINNMRSCHEATSQKFSWANIHERFQSPQLEWAGFTLGTKMKNLFFSLGAIGIALASLWLVKKKKLELSPREKWMTLTIALSIAVYSIHFFFFHPFMWQRHFHSALYSGLGLWIYWGTKWVRVYSLGFRQVVWVAFVLVALQVIKAKDHPLLHPSLSYSRTCTDLHSYLCDPSYYKK